MAQGWKLVPLNRPDVAPYPVSTRLRSQLSYFQGDPAAAGAPVLAEGEVWFDPEEVSRWLEEGVFALISPLDTQNATEVELTEEQEALLGWLHSQNVVHARIDG